MARIALAITLLAAGCGLTTRDYTVQATIVAGGGAPGGNPTFNSAELTSPLAADVSQISNVNLKSAALAATDGGDLSFISHVEIDANGSGLSQVSLGTLASAPAAGVNTVELQVNSGTNLKQYLQVGGLIVANVQYGTVPVTARTVLVTLTFEGSLF